MYICICFAKKVEICLGKIIIEFMLSKCNGLFKDYNQYLFKNMNVTDANNQLNRTQMEKTGGSCLDYYFIQLKV